MTDILLGLQDLSTTIQGGCKGADSIAKQIAIDNQIDYVTYQAEWDRYGRRAGPLRNQK